MQTLLVIAIIDGAQVIRLMLGWSLADVELRARYLWRDNAITSLEVYGVIIAGWASNSKYALLGALRASAQMVSYEIAMGFCLVVVLMVTGSSNSELAKIAGITPAGLTFTGKWLEPPS